MLLKKTYSPSPIDHQLLTDASVRGGLHPSPCEITACIQAALIGLRGSEGEGRGGGENMK